MRVPIGMSNSQHNTAGLLEPRSKNMVRYCIIVNGDVGLNLGSVAHSNCDATGPTR